MPLRTPQDLKAFVLADPLCRELAALARSHDRAIAMVGGCVRDWLLGRPALDWDLVLPGDPKPLVEAYARQHKGPVVVLDAEMGVVRTRLKRGLVLDFTRQQGDRLDVDLARRDLTINALACDLETGTLIDPTGGLADLEAGLIRAVSRSNLEDDPLRMLRIYRFAATLGYAVEAETAGWVRTLAPEIGRSAGERVLAELGKLLASALAPEALAAADQAGLLHGVLPELGPEGLAEGLATSRALAQVLGALETDFGEAGARTAAAFDASLAGDRPIRAVLMLAALLKSLGEVEAVGERLKWSNKEDAWLAAVAHTPGAAQAAAAEADTARAVYRLMRAHQGIALGLIAIAMATGLPPAQGAPLLETYWTIHDRRAATPRWLTGHDLMKMLGLSPGPHLGRILEGLDEAQALGEVCSREEALACAASLAAAGE